MAKKLKITFYGGAQEVTGSNFLVEHESMRILVDCGLVQGENRTDGRNEGKFPYDPRSIDVLFVTHAHADHTGLVPKLVKAGFSGKIYSTPPTKDIAKLMLLDTAKIFSREKEKDPEAPILYEADDVMDAMRLWETPEYHEKIALSNDLSVEFKDAGHILGSAMVVFSYNGKKLVFTGDLGNSPAPLLHDTESIDGANYLVMESVYGNRNHEAVEERGSTLERIINDTMHRGGVLMIPAFSIERTQDMLYEINDMVNNKKIPNVPIYLDSPLAIDVTNAYRDHKDYFNKSAKQESILDDLFDFPNLTLTDKVEDSIAISKHHGPKMIIAGSGMSSGGRILHHEKRYLPDPNNTLLLVGYQAVGTLGREIAEGAKYVNINDEQVPVRAEILNIRAYSAHKDMDGLLEFVEDAQDTLEKVFVVLGEPESAMFFAQRVKDYIDIETHVPKRGESVEVSFE